MQQNMKWRDLIEFVNLHPELLDEDVRGFNNDTDTLYNLDRKSTRLNSSHIPLSRMPSSA